MFFIKTILFLVFITMEGIRDLRKRSISMKSVQIFGMAGIVMRLSDIKEEWISIVGGFLIGAVLLLIAKITREKIGYGDGWIFAVSGIYLGFYDNLGLFLITLLLSAGTSVVLLVLKKVTVKTELPFVSFVLPAYFLTVLLQ